MVLVYFLLVLLSIQFGVCCTNPCEQLSGEISTHLVPQLGLGDEIFLHTILFSAYFLLKLQKTSGSYCWGVSSKGTPYHWGGFDLAIQEGTTLLENSTVGEVFLGRWVWKFRRRLPLLWSIIWSILGSFGAFFHQDRIIEGFSLHLDAWYSLVGGFDIQICLILVFITYPSFRGFFYIVESIL